MKYNSKHTAKNLVLNLTHFTCPNLFTLEDLDSAQMWILDECDECKFGMTLMY